MQHIDVDQVEELVEKNEAILIDCMPSESYKTVHIPGAISIPFDDPESFELKVEQKGIREKDKTIVTYCRDEDCELSPAAAHVLEDHMGFKDVREFDGGLVGWRRAGNAFEGQGPKKVKL